MTELVEGRCLKVTLSCRLFGHTRQAWYQSKVDVAAEVERERLLLENVHEIRQEDPRIGGYKLWLMLCAIYGREKMMGRDSFFALLRRHSLMLPPPKPRHTTNSNHRYHKWKNLIKDFVPMAANQLWVADITYIMLNNGDVCYLHLITDAYSRMIVGWELADTLRAAITIKALEGAISQAGSISLEGLIHHSDRGVQYCCDEYVGVLKNHGIKISMTEDYNPTDNAIAERTNGIIKSETVYSRKTFNSMEHAKDIIGRFINFYNYRRPHMSIGYKIPAVVHMENGPQKKMWKNNNYPNKMCKNENNEISLSHQIMWPDSCVPIKLKCQADQHGIEKGDNHLSMARKRMSTY